MSADIAKAARERRLPVIPDLVPLVDEIRASVGRDEYVLPKSVAYEKQTNVLGLAEALGKP